MVDATWPVAPRRILVIDDEGEVRGVRPSDLDEHRPVLQGASSNTSWSRAMASGLGPLAPQSRGRSAGSGLVAGRFGATSAWTPFRSEEHTSELQSLMRISYAVFCLTKKKPLKRT